MMNQQQQQRHRHDALPLPPLTSLPPLPPLTSLTPWRVAFWGAFLTTMRPYLAPVSGTSGLVGLAIAQTQPQQHAAPHAFWSALAVFFLAYGFGQAATDVFQTDTDAISSPYRPLVRKLVSKRDVLVVSLLGLLGCGLVLGVSNWQIIVLAGLGVVGLLTYTPLKRRFWGGPLYNAWIVALLPAMGSMVGGASLLTALGTPRVLLAMASALLSYAVFVVLGYLKDVDADRATGYETVAVRFGRRAAIGVSAVLALLSLIPSAFLGGTRIPFWWVGVVMLVTSHITMLRVTKDRDAHPSIAMSVRAFVFLRLGEALALDRSLFLHALVIALILELALRTRPEASQV